MAGFCSSPPLPCPRPGGSNNHNAVFCPLNSFSERCRACEMPSLGMSSSGEGGTQLLARFLPVAASTEQGQAAQGEPGRWILVQNPKGSGCVLGNACYLSSLWGSNLWRHLRAGSRLLTGDLQLALIVVGVKIFKKRPRRGGRSRPHCSVLQNSNYSHQAASNFPRAQALGWCVAGGVWIVPRLPAPG